MKRVALYFRVSTSGQTTDNQERELRTVAKKAGWDRAGLPGRRHKRRQGPRGSAGFRRPV